MRTVKQKTPQSTIEIPLLVKLIGVNKEEAESVSKTAIQNIIDDVGFKKSECIADIEVQPNILECKKCTTK